MILNFDILETRRNILNFSHKNALLSFLASSALSGLQAS